MACQVGYGRLGTVRGNPLLNRTRHELLRPKAILQGGPLQRGWIIAASDERWMLQEVLEQRYSKVIPPRILTGDDREFFLSLPEHFTVYRGCAGISAERAAEGLCWTIKRENSFANRSAWFNGGAPVVVTAKIRKSQVYFAKALGFEIVAAPSHARPIKARRRKASPVVITVRR